MTVCGVARLQAPSGEIFITCVSDSEVSTSDVRLVGLKDTCKLIKIKDSVVALSGSGSILESCEEILLDHTFLDQLDLCTRVGVRALGEQIFTLFKEISERSLTPEVVNHVGELLIASPSGIFKIYPDFSCYAFNRMASSGIGQEFWLAAMTVLMEQLEALPNPSQEDLNEAAIKAAEVTCIHSLHCNPPIHCIIPDKECIPPKPRKGRKPKKQEAEFLI